MNKIEYLILTVTLILSSKFRFFESLKTVESVVVTNGKVEFFFLNFIYLHLRVYFDIIKPSFTRISSINEITV